MKLKDYLEKINKLIEENPEAAEFNVMYSMDDEGNGYCYVYYDPSLMHYNKNTGEMSKKSEINVIVIN